MHVFCIFVWMMLEYHHMPADLRPCISVYAAHVQVCVFILQSSNMHNKNRSKSATMSLHVRYICSGLCGNISLQTCMAKTEAKAQPCTCMCVTHVLIC